MWLRPPSLGCWDDLYMRADPILKGAWRGGSSSRKSAPGRDYGIFCRPLSRSVDGAYPGGGHCFFWASSCRKRSCCFFLWDSLSRKVLIIPPIYSLICLKSPSQDLMFPRSVSMVDPSGVFPAPPYSGRRGVEYFHDIPDLSMEHGFFSGMKGGIIQSRRLTSKDDAGG